MEGKINMNDKPLVSVCIPSYNHAQYLPYCIESVLSQTYPNIELIIVDDGSKDNSLEIAQNYAAKYPDLIQVHTHPKKENRGISNTVNLGFSLSRGKYWSGLSSDDALYKDKIEKQVAYLEANSEIGFVYGYGDYINSEGEKLPGIFGTNITNEPDPLKTLLTKNVIPGMTVLARREAMEQVGLHDENLVYSDWDFWIRFVALYKVGFIPESLVEYRVHNSNTSVGIPLETDTKYSSEVVIAMPKKAKQMKGKLLQNLVFYRRLHGEWIADYHVNLFFKCASEGRIAEGYSYLKKAFLFYPKPFFRIRRLGAIVKYSIIGLKQRRTICI